MSQLPVDRPIPPTATARPAGPATWLTVAAILVALGLLGAATLGGAEGRPVQAAVQWPTINFVPYMSGFSDPVFLTNAGDGTGRVFVVERAGVVKVVSGATVSTFLDIKSKVDASSGERGLLSVAFPPNYAAKGYFYVFYTAKPAGDVQVARYFLLAGNSNAADPNSEQPVLTHPHTAGNHNGGQLQFGPDGYLYFTIGDNATRANAQDLTNLFGKVSRINPEGIGTTPPATYTIPANSPFVGTAGARGEIWAYGLRNPWRFSFDRLTGDLYIGDVGEVSREEIDFQPAGSPGGQNYGWPLVEGNICTFGTDCPPTPTPTPTPPPNTVLPVFDYSHSFGCAVTGGYVYRGPSYPRLTGIYFLGDFCSKRVWGLQRDGVGGPWVGQELTYAATVGNIQSWGEDEAGRLYVVGQNGAILQLVDTAGTATPSATATGTPATPTATRTPTATGTPATATATPTGTVTAALGNLQLLANPIRVVDTRPNAPGIATTGFDPSGNPIAAGPLAANTARQFQIGGKTFGATGVPANTTGLLLNVTTVQGAPSGGYLVVYPADGSAPPNASTVNPSTAVAFNFWQTRLPANGQIAVFSTNPADVAIDLLGYYSPTAPATLGGLQFVAPVRVLDTRPNAPGVTTTGFNADAGNTPVTAGPIPAGQTRKYRLGGRTFGAAAFPTDITGVLANVTIVQPGGPSGGFVTMFPANLAAPPNVSTVNPATGVDQNFWTMALPTSGTDTGAFSIFTTNTLDVAVDVVGYYRAGLPATTLTPSLVGPVRVVDTRPTGGIVTTTGFDQNGGQIAAGPVAPGTTRLFKIAGRTFGGVAVPADAKAVLVNVTTVQPGGTGGFVAVFPGDVASTNTSTVNPSTAVAFNFWGTGLAAANGTLAAQATGTSPQLDLAIDLVGYYR